MCHHQKTKPDVTAEIPLQLLSENSIEAHVVISADSGTLSISREKRKEDANKPLYLKRV